MYTSSRFSRSLQTISATCNETSNYVILALILWTSGISEDAEFHDSFEEGQHCITFQAVLYLFYMYRISCLQLLLFFTGNQACMLSSLILLTSVCFQFVFLTPCHCRTTIIYQKSLYRTKHIIFCILLMHFRLRTIYCVDWNQACRVN